MSSFDDKTLAVAKVYAAAMLDLAAKRGEADELGDELHQMVRLAERDPRFARFLADPLADAGERRESIEKMFRGQASDLLVDSLQVLNRKGRFGILPAITQVYHQELDRLRKRVEVQVTSAVPLTDELRHRLAAAVEGQTGRKARLDERVDESLLGGMVVQIGDRKIDASVTTRLEGLAAAMLDRASREIHRGAHVEG